MVEVLWYFYIYSFIGWCVEVIYAAAKTGKFVNRGFLNGPVCPIYGEGVLLVLYLLNPVKDNILYVFLGSVLITSIIEYIAGFLLQKIFKQRWWDYSEMPFNISGYVCLMFSIMWGLACLILVDRIHPIVYSLVAIIPEFVSNIILMILSVLFIVDVISTVRLILKLNKKLELIDDITIRLKETSNNIGENLAEKVVAAVKKGDDLGGKFNEKKDTLQREYNVIKNDKLIALSHRKKALEELYKTNSELLEATAFKYKRLLTAFPGLKSTKHKEALERIRRFHIK